MNAEQMHIDPVEMWVLPGRLKPVYAKVLPAGLRPPTAEERQRLEPPASAIRGEGTSCTKVYFVQSSLQAAFAKKARAFVETYGCAFRCEFVDANRVWVLVTRRGPKADPLSVADQLGKMRRRDLEAWYDQHQARQTAAQPKRVQDMVNFAQGLMSEEFRADLAKRAQDLINSPSMFLRHQEATPQAPALTMPSDMPGIRAEQARVAMLPKPEPEEVLTPRKPAPLGLTTVSGFDHRLGAWR